MRQMRKTSDDGERVGRSIFLQRLGRRRAVDAIGLNCFGGIFALREPIEKIAELNSIRSGDMNRDPLRSSRGWFAAVELRGVEAHAHVGDERAEHEHESADST